uniref:Uncharacterized protein n=1 Tax=Oryza brachyantha TaxID=4533 RepID=J3LHR5_ORYBR
RELRLRRQGIYPVSQPNFRLKSLHCLSFFKAVTFSRLIFGATYNYLSYKKICFIL